jgi:A/G-specific adenine glycosylase
MSGGQARRTRAVQVKLLAWYARHRRDLPWRRTRDPYAIWLSEVMLQQTRVDTVIPYYERFLATYPSVHALAEAPLDNVLGLWSGLGYYRRARMLHAGAEEVVRERKGVFPTSAAELLTLPGVGRYTAGAVASIAWGEPVPVVDGNVTRVLSRIFAVDADLQTGKGTKRMWDLAESLVVREEPSSWNQALMELGALTCLPKTPRCTVCPVRSECQARSQGLVDELPRTRARKPPLALHRVGFVLRSEQGILVARRVADGLFGGMWEPPHLDDPGPRAREALLAAAGPGVRRAGAVTHVLSHRRIEMDVYAGKGRRALIARLRAAPDYDTSGWVPERELGERALTSLARKVLGLAGVVVDSGRREPIRSSAPPRSPGPPQTRRRPA